MEKTKEYRNTVFPVETLKKAIVEFDSLAKTERTIKTARFLGSEKEDQPDEEVLSQQTSRVMKLTRLDETWHYDSEDQFFADYRKYAPNTGHRSFCYRRSLVFHSLQDTPSAR